MNTINPFAKPLYVMLKPVGASCNLRCKYCYYLEKANLYKHTPTRVLSEDMLEQFTKEYIEAQTMNEVLFTWHGGETLMRPLSFFRKAVELQKNMVQADASTTPYRPTARCSLTSGASFCMRTIGLWGSL